ncbi:hypothetical protein [Streptomyces sp. NPDC058739]|uniref:hypothetical protein n=1 Tax=Streptomyces sp. NPDC058739 TaxID=3346618 RepID=UPI0036AAD600
MPCTVNSLAERGHLHGRVRLPTGQLAVCGCVAIRGGDQSSDWLDFYVPVGALDQADVAHWDGRSFFRSSVMDDWLAILGTRCGSAFALVVLIAVLGAAVGGDPKDGSGKDKAAVSEDRRTRIVPATGGRASALPLSARGHRACVYRRGRSRMLSWLKTSRAA